MPKTAINFYNMRKGLYIKNGHANSNSRHASTKIMMNSGTTTKSSGILNAYGELATNDGMTT